VSAKQNYKTEIWRWIRSISRWAGTMHCFVP